ncbi:pyruvate ferredoxin oxidoreductase, partial [Candidatus Woesearchaeota archaeon]|nr:pyruvate ferredoxin oxidoreductase [Candidatus Woesearchaeota archaeon]
AMSCCIGASAAGARVMTATAANGLALMLEIVYIASSTRLPIVMNVVNRALSAPINIHCDHSDSMMARDACWIQLYSENPQEAYDNTILAMKIAETPKVRLPVMVCQDGFITSHCVECVEVLETAQVKSYVGEYKPVYPLLDIKKPVTVGPLDLFDYYFEHKRQQSEAMTNVFTAFENASLEYEKISGRKLNLVESYRLEDAKFAIVAMNSSAGTAKHAVDELRQKGVKAGLLKIRMFRPFPKNEVVEALKHVDNFAVLDRAESFSLQGGPLFIDLRAAFYREKTRPKAINYIYGLGGRELTLEHVHQLFDELQAINGAEDFPYIRYLGVRE